MLSKFLPFIFSALLLAGVIWYGGKSINKIKYDYEEQAKKLQALHQAELEEIGKARKIEKDQLEANISKLQNQLAENQREYERKLTELVLKKGRETVEIARKDVVEVTSDVSAATGFKVYKPGK